MVYTLYILYSEKTQKFYTGHTNDFERRIIEHNSGQNKSTKSGSPWEIVYRKEYETKSEAARIESKIKKMKSKDYIILFIKNSKPD
jgi:putative endonuclease